MNITKWVRGCTSLMMAASLMLPATAFARDPVGDLAVQIAPRSSDEVASYTHRVEDSPYLTHEQKLDLLQKKIKYVFVLFQENRSFDFYFGTYPGARGLFSQSASQTPGFVQPIVMTNGTVGTISPFKIPQSVTDINGKTVLLYPEDTDSVNHGHTAIDAKLDLDANHVAQNNRYAFTEEGLKGTLSADGTTYTGLAPTEQQVQKGELVVSHVDCDTAPFLWNYADRFILFDNFFDTVIGPSTPNAIAMIAGQSGKTQWMLHPELAAANAASTYPAPNTGQSNAQLPVTSDPQPFWGNSLAPLVESNPPSSPPSPGALRRRTRPPTRPLPSLPLSFMGKQIKNITASRSEPRLRSPGRSGRHREDRRRP